VEGSSAAEWELPVDPGHEEALGDWIFISARLKGFIGFADHEFPNSVSAWFARIHPEDVTRIREKTEEHQRQRTPAYQAEYRIRHKDGTWRWISSAGRLFRDSHGQARRWVGLDWDITVRKEAEAALRQSEAAFRLLAEAMPQLVWTASPEGIVDYYNSRVHLYAGARQRPDGGWEWEAMLHPEDRELTWEAWKKAVAQGTVYQAEHRVRLVDGTYRWHLSRAEPGRDPAGRVIKWFGTATDIEDQKRAQETLEWKVQERTARLRDTVADLEHFSYTITHDMRAPLRAMHAFAQLLREDYGDRFDEVARDYLRRITEASTRMDNLITDALNYSKATRSELVLEPIDPGPLLRSIVESYPMLQPPEATVELADRFPKVLGNQAGLTQCFSNLLGNAVKFVARGVTPRVRVWAEERGERVRFWFEDNGIGIPPNQRERVFIMFHRLSKDYEGTGVGLALVQKVVQRMQGQVGIEPAPEQGTCFWIELRHAPDPELMTGNVR
jgi:PAS domain S-box-containing protein